MHVTDLAIHQLLGIQLAPAGVAHLLALPSSPLLLNHLGTIHAGVQFAFAEACSGEFLLRHFDHDPSQAFAVLRASRVKFHKPARGELRASARFVDEPSASPRNRLTVRGSILVAVRVEVSDENGLVTMSGRYDWFLRRPKKRSNEQLDDESKRDSSLATGR